MSVSILLLSVVFALIETGLSWLILACQPVAMLTEGIPTWLLTGSVFALGMLLSFIVIIVIGLLEIGPRAATFVRGHVGRTILLGFLSMILVFALGMGGEALYHVGPYESVETVVKQEPTDVCFVLDFSGSMAGDGVTSLKAAFAQAINDLPDGQRVCVVRYESQARVLRNWIELNASSRALVINAVQAENTSGGTDFSSALQMAGDMVEQEINGGRQCSVIMLSDGRDSGFRSVAIDAPKLIQYKVPVYTMYAGDTRGGDTATLQNIANETGGEMKVTDIDLANMTISLTEVTQKAANTQAVVENDYIPDTLLTERDEGRMGLFDIRAMRMVMLFIAAFAFKLICVICVGNNHRFVGHFLHAFFVSALAVAAVEFGYAAGLPVIAVLAVFWALMMNQIVLTR